MKIDLHIHTRDGSDGNLPVDEIFEEADKRRLGFISITDHDSVSAQRKAVILAEEYGMSYITGVELNITFQYPRSKPASLDFLGYQYDMKNTALLDKIQIMRERRESRALQILEKLNTEFDKENIQRLTQKDIKAIEAGVDGAFGRPHIADYLIKKGIVKDRQEAFDKYLVKCDVPKYPLSLDEASRLVRDAGGKLVHAHPCEPEGTSLVSFSRDLNEQLTIIEKYMLEYIDGIECFHPRHDSATTAQLVDFARKHRLLVTGGSDCHQKPVLMGSIDIPDFIARQFYP
ncbi:PHP domain-containing protein [Chloroflexota bacterium]